MARPLGPGKDWSSFSNKHAIAESTLYITETFVRGAQQRRHSISWSTIYWSIITTRIWRFFRFAKLRLVTTSGGKLFSSRRALKHRERKCLEIMAIFSRKFTHFWHTFYKQISGTEICCKTNLRWAWQPPQKRSYRHFYISTVKICIVQSFFHDLYICKY